MALPDSARLQDLISWTFETHEQTQTSRYGEYAGAFWKQYLPSGMAEPSLHPPRKILPALYEFAKRRAQPLKPA